MAQTTTEQRTRYPLSVYNFRVKVHEVAMSFTEVSGLNITHDHVVYRHGLTFLEGEQIETFRFDAFQPITCKRGVILGAQPLFMHDWMRKGRLLAMEVSLCDDRGAPVLAWKIAAAVPTKIEAPAFNAGANEVAIESVELQARGISVVRIGASESLLDDLATLGENIAGRAWTTIGGK